MCDGDENDANNDCGMGQQQQQMRTCSPFFESGRRCESMPSMRITYAKAKKWDDGTGIHNKKQPDRLVVSREWRKDDDHQYSSAVRLARLPRDLQACSLFSSSSSSSFDLREDNSIGNMVGWK